MTTWEYPIVELPRLEAPTHAPGTSSPVQALEAIGLTPRGRRKDRGPAQKPRAHPRHR
jgi:hypothetical protein